MGRTSPTLRRAWPKDGPLAAICVQSVDVQCVLQFTLIHAAGCVLHRRTSRVIHRLKLFLFSFQSGRASCSAHARGMRSEPVASNRKIGKMIKAANRKQKKPGGGTRPRGRRDSLNLRRRTDRSAPEENESFLPLERQTTAATRESGPPFPSASLAETADGSLTRARRKPDIPSKPGTPQSQFFGWRADRNASRAKL